MLSAPQVGFATAIREPATDDGAMTRRPVVPSDTPPEWQKPFRPRLAKDVVLVGAQLLSPFGLGALDLGHAATVPV